MPWTGRWRALGAHHAAERPRGTGVALQARKRNSCVRQAALRIRTCRPWLLAAAPGPGARGVKNKVAQRGRGQLGWQREMCPRGATDVTIWRMLVDNRSERTVGSVEITLAGQHPHLLEQASGQNTSNSKSISQVGHGRNCSQGGGWGHALTIQMKIGPAPARFGTSSTGCGPVSAASV